MTAILDTCATTGLFAGDDTVFSVYDGCPTLGGVEIECDDDSGGTGVQCGGAYSGRSYLRWSPVPNVTYYFHVGGWQGIQGPIGFRIGCVYRHVWSEPNGPGSGSIRLETADGPPGAAVISAVTLDLLHPDLPAASDFPHGWFFGVPIGYAELLAEIGRPGGLPFVHSLDAAGYRLNFSAPNGTTSGFGTSGLNASLYSVAVAFDPAFGFTTVGQTTEPTVYVIP
jgi:hypothetical protein